MFEMVKAIYKNKLMDLQNNLKAKKVEARFLREASDLVVDRPDTTGGWTKRYQVNDWEKGHIQANQLEVVRKCREMDRWDAHAHGILSTMVNYIMGKGLTLQPKSDDPMVWYIWRDFSTDVRNKWIIKQFEVVRRVFRDGEVFIRFFKKDDQGNNTGKTTIRFLDPLLIRHPTEGVGKITDEPNESIKNGVVTNPEDVEEVIAYQYMDRVNRTKFETIPAEEVHHIKINADSDQKRGEPGIQTCLQYFRHYMQWLENRIILNKMRSAIVLIKSVTGTPTEVANMSKTLPLATRQTGAGETKLKNFRGGTIITAGPGIKYDMLSANINAQDVKEDGRNIILAMAAAMNMPEYIFGDSSNANYASTMIAESPFVKMVQFFQTFFEYHFAQIFRKVIEIAVEADLVVAPNDDEFIAKLKEVRTLAEAEAQPPQPGAKPMKKPDLSPREAALKELMPNGKMETPTEIFYGIDITWPEIVHREMDKQASALALARQNGWISDPTASSALGYDYSEEVRKQRQIEEDAEIDDNPLLTVGGGDGDASDMSMEMNRILGELSPEERDTVMNSKDPNEIKAIMDKHQNGGTPAKAGSGLAKDDPGEETN